MTKKELSAVVAEKLSVTKKDSLEVIDAVIDSIQEVLEQGDEVWLYGFGRFHVTSRDAYQGINPSTREPMEIAARKIVNFKPAKQLKDLLNK